MMSSSIIHEWYRVGDEVIIHAPQDLAENGDLPDELREWVQNHGSNLFVIHKIDKEDIPGVTDKKPIYTLRSIDIRSIISPEGFYHEELRLVKAGQRDWDE